MPTNPIGTIFGNVMRINNALVLDVTCSNNSTGSLLISYTEPGRNQTQNLRLNLNRNTSVVNSLGQNMCICCIQRGMRINAVAESRMTRSIPPQANALVVSVRRNVQPSPQPPRPPFPPQPPRPTPQSSVTTGRIIMIDFDNNYLITEDPRNRNNQTRFNITNATTFRNRFGMPIRFEDLQPGEMARITHANFMTFSIPPQTTAFHIQLL